MRSDMYKVIVERPRLGAGWDKPGRAPRDGDEDRPDREALRRRPGLRRKQLNENLQPLRRWLDRQVGRRWDGVYSELCARVDRRNTVQQHIHLHLRDFVAIDVIERDDRLWAMRSWGGRVALADSRCELYVDPRNGCLMRNHEAAADRARRVREHRLAVRARDAGWREGVRRIDETTQLHRVDGIWYRVTLGAAPRCGRRKPDPAAAAPRAFDVVLHADVGRCAGARCERYGRCGVYAHSKRQLSQTELSAYRLRNGDGPDPFDPRWPSAPRASGRKFRGPLRQGAQHKEH